jgi:hypothetical protein
MEDLEFDGSEAVAPSFNGQYFKYSTDNYLDIESKPLIFRQKYAKMTSDCMDTLERKAKAQDENLIKKPIRVNKYTKEEWNLLTPQQ